MNSPISHGSSRRVLSFALLRVIVEAVCFVVTPRMLGLHGDDARLRDLNQFVELCSVLIREQYGRVAFDANTMIDRQWFPAGGGNKHIRTYGARE